MAAAKQLNNFGRAAAVALTELKQAQMAAAEACGGLEIMAALALVEEQEALIEVWSIPCAQHERLPFLATMYRYCISTHILENALP